MMAQRFRQHIILLLITCTLVLSLASCSAEDDGVQTIIGLSQLNLSDQAQLAIKSEMLERCRFYQDLRCISFDAGFDSNDQMNDIQRLMDLGADALVVVTDDPEPISDAIAKAFDTGIPVIIIGYVPDHQKYSTRIFTDYLKVGALAGDYAVKQAAGRACTVLEIFGDAESLISQELKQGFAQTIQSVANISKEYVMTGYWSQDRTIERLQESDFASKGPIIDLIFAHNDLMAIGAAKVAKPENKDIKIIGVGGFAFDNGELPISPDGTIDATISVSAGGLEAVDAAVRLLNGEDVPRQIELESALVTASDDQQP